MAFPFSTVAFDLDGTIADTAPDLAASLNHALIALGREPIAPASVRPLIGHGARALIRRGLDARGGGSEALADEALRYFLEHYRDNICIGTRVYPGLETCLDELAGEGIALAVCTNKPEELARSLLRALGLATRLRSVVGGNTLHARKPDPAPLRLAIARAGGGPAVLVGDSIIDTETAHAASIPFIAVSFGFADRSMMDLGADAVIDSFGELPDALRTLTSDDQQPRFTL